MILCKVCCYCNFNKVHRKPGAEDYLAEEEPVEEVVKEQPNKYENAPPEIDIEKAALIG